MNHRYIKSKRQREGEEIFVKTLAQIAIYLIIYMPNLVVLSPQKLHTRTLQLSKTIQRLSLLSKALINYNRV
jgi:hypothetical protein